MSRKNIEAIYRLSPLQQGMLFHARLEPDGNTYFDQFNLRFGAVNTDIFRQVWQRIIDRHSVLRTAFVWRDLKEPVQVVHKKVEVAFQVIDWRDVPADQQPERLRTFYAEDRRRGFDLTRAPIMRVTVIQLAEDASQVVWSYHHLLLDGWSVGLVLQELPVMYQAVASGTPAKLPPARPYRDYVNWLGKQDLGAAEAYWRETLAGIDAATPLGIDRPSSDASATGPSDVDHSADETGGFNRVFRQLSKETHATLQSFARGRRLTMPTVVQGAWALLLSRLSGHDDVVYGLTVSGRPYEIKGVHQMVGCFINTLPMRVVVDGRTPVAEWLEGVQARQLGMRKFEHSPQVEVRRWAGFPGQMPLFESIVVYEGFGGDTPGQNTEYESFQRTNFPLVIGAMPKGDGMLNLFVGTDRRRIDDRAAERVIDQLVRVLTAFAEDPDQPLGAVPLLGEGERRRMLVDWNTPEETYPEASLVHALVEAQAADTPEAVAVTFEGETVSYAELEARANRLAHHLRARGVGPESVVGVALHRSPDLVVALYAVWKAGGAYLPLDPAYPTERLRFMVDDAAAPVVITAADAAAHLDLGADRLLRLDGEADAIARRTADAPPTAGVAPDSPAYVIYTSGSTGKPKGVVVPHGAVANRLQWVRSVDLDGGVAFLQKTTVSFDVSVAEIFAPLVSGGRTVLPRPGGEKDTDYLLGLIEEAGVTHTSFPPTLLAALLDEERFTTKSRSVRSVITGGETVPATLPERFYDALPDAVLENRYGPTEATISVTAWPCKPGVRERVLPIGRPIAGAEIYIVDRRLEPVPVGVAGEILIGGVCLARGYLNRPVVTAAAFVPHPFAEQLGQPGARLYRSGDLARYREDGAIEFVGRVDQQIKIRGFRVELGEIEAALDRLPAVREAAVVDLDDGDSKRLVAYLTTEVEGDAATPALDVHAVKAALVESLPSHMVPAAFVVLDELPLSATGKVDRKALPAPDWQDGSAPSVAPRTPVEELLASIWREVLGRDTVGVHDDFFALGGHSLLATQVASRLRKTFGVELPLRMLFERSTVAGLALAVEQAQRAEQGLEAPPIEPVVSGAESVVVSYAQERLWFLDKFEPGNPWFNIPAAVRLTGDLDVDRMRAALQAIVDRHATLRTTFADTPDGAVQRIAPQHTLDVPLEDLVDEDGGEVEGAIRRRAIREASTPFDLSKGPLVRVRLLRVAPDDHVALLTMHHVVSDGWSMGIFVRELAALYRAVVEDPARDLGEGTEGILPPLPVQYADFAVWQRGWLQGEVLGKQLAYWREQLEGAPSVLELPTDRPRPPVQTYAGATVSRRLDPEVTHGLEALGQARGGTLFMVLLAAFASVLGRMSGQADVVVGTPIANRNRVETEGLIGFFVNALVLRLGLEPGAPFASLVERAREVTLGAYAHQDVPFEKLVQELQPQRDLSHAPLFQVMLVLQNAPMDAFELPGVTLSPVPAGAAVAKYDLTLTTAEGVDGGLGLALEYNTDLFDAATAERLLGCFETFCAAAVDAPDTAWDALPLLDEDGRGTLVRDWNDTVTDYRGDRSLVALVAEQAAKRPDAEAVRCGDVALDYAALMERVNRLANHLRALGVGPEVRVGLCVDRSIDLVVGTLGIMAAGGAYIPLDPAYPADRIDYVLGDAGVAALVTQETLLATLPALANGVALVCLDRDRASIDACSEQAPLVELSPDNLAYAIYTSGSTGRPKGVQIAHRPLINFLETMAEAPGFAHDDTLVAVTTLSFDIAGLELYLPLLQGGRVVIAPQDTTIDARRLARLLDEVGATVMQATPATWRLLLASGWQGRAGLRALCGGEALPRELADGLLGTGVTLWNLYGPTETTIWSATEQVTEDVVSPSIGRPIGNTQVYLLDRLGAPVPIGASGELLIGGDGLARGYLGRPALTAERFVPDPFATAPGRRLYRTGDLARWRADGRLDYQGRMDHQVKVRGFRIELGEIEAVLAEHEAVAQAVVVAREDTPGDQRLVAYVVAAAGHEAPDTATARQVLRTRLPEYMLPSRVVTSEVLPLTPNGKVDRGRLMREPLPVVGGEAETPTVVDRVAPSGEVEESIAAIWCEVLGIAELGVFDNFFDLGGHSLLMVQVQNKLQERFTRELSMVDLFRFPTVRALADHLASDAPAAPKEGGISVAERVGARKQGAGTQDIAIVGMVGRFPGADSVEELWQVFRDGVEAITFFTDQELIAAGIAPAALEDPAYVKAKGVLRDHELFDAAFFDYAPREAQVMDPQQRIFLESAWQALENAGYDPSRYPGRIGVFGGVGMNYYQFNLASYPGLVQAVGIHQTLINNDKDFLPTRVSYKLNLDGPSVNVQTACSTSLVAVGLACDTLLHHRADMVLAGGVTVRETQQAGYRFEEGGILSPDGHTRAFDAGAAGTVAGSGVGIVVLKRLEDALADGDTVRAVIKGYALNNDGAVKVGFTAPSVEGQAEVIAEAHAAAGVDPSTITYIETHGTGTALGDPIEVAALSEAFRAGTDEIGFCALGSAKTNLGHLDTAAGVTGLIKATLSLQHRQIAPSLNFDAPNPAIDFQSSPFFVNTALRDWTTSNGTPRRAGVSSFGIGGTNAHVVLEEAPEPAELEPGDPWQLLALSARSGAALERATTQLAAHLEAHPEQDLADVAYTLQQGRKTFPFRRFVVARDRDEAITLLGAPAEARDERVVQKRQPADRRPVVFLFPGGGAQYRRMAFDLYETESVFRDEIDRCAELAQPLLDFDLRDTLFASGDDAKAADVRLRRTSFALPALFATEIALGRLLLGWGIRPHAMIGHSLGEYAAAHLAGVLRREDAMAMVCLRARLFEQLPEGTMLSVPLPLAELEAELGDELAVAAVNTPELSVASGPVEAIEALAARLEARGIETSRLHIDVAAHSPMVEPILAEFGALVETIELRAPAIPYLSNVTGTWVREQDVTDPAYWSRHLRQTVRFADCLGALFADTDAVLLEVGPGQTLSTLARQHPERPQTTTVRTTLRHPREARSDVAYLRHALGLLWADGAEIDWRGVHGAARRRVPLPTYPFERKRYWVERRQVAAGDAASPAAPAMPLLAADATTDADGELVERVAPRTDLERRIAAVWQEILGVEGFGIHDDFFELGGSSLMAVRLGSRLREALGLELSPHFLIESPTIARLATALEDQLVDAGDTRSSAEGESAPASCLVTLQPGDGTTQPLVLIHPVGGHVYFYQGVVRSLGRRQTVYGIRARGLDEGEQAFEDVSEMATYYVSLLREKQPEGPYRLGGSSMGGMIAYEMAQQLRRDGDSVDLLALLDTAGPGQMPVRPQDDAEVLAYLVRDRMPLSLDELKKLDPEAQIEAVLLGAQREGALPGGLDLPAARRLLTVVKSHLKGLFAYQPEPYDGRVLFMRAAERRHWDPEHPERTWIELASGGTEVHVVPGDHISMHHPPHLDALSARLRQALSTLGGPIS